VVGATGFEPATPCAQGRCATRLRYAPTLKILDFTASSSVTPNCLPIDGHTSSRTAGKWRYRSSSRLNSRRRRLDLPSGSTAWAGTSSPRRGVWRSSAWPDGSGWAAPVQRIYTPPSLGIAPRDARKPTIRDALIRTDSLSVSTTRSGLAGGS
jgi:hypothetical protein